MDLVIGRKLRGQKLAAPSLSQELTRQSNQLKPTIWKENKGQKDEKGLSTPWA